MKIAPYFYSVPNGSALGTETLTNIWLFIWKVLAFWNFKPKTKAIRVWLTSSFLLTDFAITTMMKLITKTVIPLNMSFTVYWSLNMDTIFWSGSHITSYSIWKENVENPREKSHPFLNISYNKRFILVSTSAVYIYNSPEFLYCALRLFCVAIIIYLFFIIIERDQLSLVTKEKLCNSNTLYKKDMIEWLREI